ncbi:MAG: sigma-54 dependent transcriptional regulator [Acidobacteriota bacterium]|nr:sigma-54 dependent transcriptional regulator [Acidobacteriota bacterium]
MPETSPHVLVADDERSIRLTLETGLTLSGFRVTCARTGREAIEAARVSRFDAVVSDILMPDGDGLDVVRELRTVSPGTPIILITAQGSVELAVRAVSEGASDFIAKPFEVASLAALVRRHLSARDEAERMSTPGSEDALEEFSRSGLVGRSGAMVSVYKLIAHAARMDATVLVLGESGTGKELVARAIHEFSPRARKPFLAINCAGLTDTLLEAELFGHTKGSFTGATTDRAGLFEAAEGGTLLLDEVASTSPAFQASLLRALQVGEVRRVGSTEVRRVNVRVIAASNAPLHELVASGSFRPDLFYRLSVLTIELPPLSERGGDVEALALHFLRKIKKGEEPARLSNEVVDALNAYAFPGNVRELENIMTRAAALCSSELITIDCLPHSVVASTNNITSSSSRNDPVATIAADRPTIEELQRRYLQLILTEVGGNRRRAAAVLGLNRRTIQRLIARYDLFSLAEKEVPADVDAELDDFSVDSIAHEDDS